MLPISPSRTDFLIPLRSSEFCISISYLTWFDKIGIVLLSRKGLFWLGKAVLHQYLSPWLLMTYLLCRLRFTVPHSLALTPGISHLFPNPKSNLPIFRSIFPRCILICKHLIHPISQVKVLLYMSLTPLSIMNWSSTRNLAFLPKTRKCVTVTPRRNGVTLRMRPSAHR